MGRRRKRRLNRTKKMQTGFNYSRNVNGHWVESAGEGIQITPDYPILPLKNFPEPDPLDKVFAAPKTTPLCEHACESEIFEQDGKMLYAGSLGGLRAQPFALDRVKLVIDCAEIIDKVKLLLPTSNEEWEFLNSYSLIPNGFSTLALDWTDGAALRAKPEFWVELWKALPQGNTVVCCLGGHGRTGTTLASLMMVAQNLDPFMTIMQLRAVHCNEAIETMGQHGSLNVLAQHLGLVPNAMMAYQVLDADAAVKILMGSDLNLKTALIDELRKRENDKKVRPNRTTSYGWAS